MERPKLKLLSEFQELLKGYHPSIEAQEILSKTRLVLLVGTTSSGRNTIINELLKSGDYHYMVSDTTRPKRQNNGVWEQEGVEYFFRNEEDYLHDLKTGMYLEAAIVHGQQVSGASIRELNNANRAGKIAINEVTPDGATTIHGIKPDAKIVFILPPSFDVWMQRLRGRGHMPEDEVRIRLQSALEEIDRALKEPIYKLVINDEFHACTNLLNKYFMHNVLDSDKELKARDHAVHLLGDVQSYLAGTLVT